MTTWWRRLTWTLVACLYAPYGTAAGQTLGADLAGIGLCYYGDCEARGSFAADPLGWTNPGTLPVAVLPEMPRGVLGSGTYYHLNAGAVGADLGAGILTVALDPVMLQAVWIYGEGSGGVRGAPGVTARIINRIAALGAAVDLGRTGWHLDGLCLGAVVAIPGLDNDLTLSQDHVTFLQVRERRGPDITVGAHWRSGVDEWFMVGGYVNGLSNDLDQHGLDPQDGSSTFSDGTTTAWISRLGLSLLPFVPVTVAGVSPAAERWLKPVRLGIDIAYSSVSVPDEPHSQRTTGYFGVDAPLLPADAGIFSKFIRPTLIAGVDTNSGWGAGIGLYGVGPLAFLSCNPAYSSRPIVESLGDRLDVWAATCTAVLPF